MSKPRFRLFSIKDGKAFSDHIDDAFTWMRGLPAKVKKLLPGAEDFVHAVQVLSDALKDGQPVDAAIDRALAFIPGEKQELFYETAKLLLENFAIKLSAIYQDINEFGEGELLLEAQAAKRDTAANLVIEYYGEDAERAKANLAVETAVFIIKQ